MAAGVWELAVGHITGNDGKQRDRFYEYCDLHIPETNVAVSIFVCYLLFCFRFTDTASSYF